MNNDKQQSISKALLHGVVVVFSVVNGFIFQQPSVFYKA